MIEPYFCIMSWTNSLSVATCQSYDRGILYNTEYFLTVNSAIAILISLPDHLVNLVIGKLLADGSHDVTKLCSGDETIVVTIEDLVEQISMKLQMIASEMVYKP